AAFPGSSGSSSCVLLWPPGQAFRGGSPACVRLPVALARGRGHGAGAVRCLAGVRSGAAVIPGPGLESVGRSLGMRMPQPHAPDLMADISPVLLDGRHLVAVNRG